MPDEIWKTTERLMGFYEVSNLGRVRRIAPPRRGVRTFIGKVLKNQLVGRAETIGHVPDRYFAVTICLPNQKPRTYKICRVVCEAFLGPPPAHMEVNHKNENKLDDRSENLEWTTHRENNRHSTKTLSSAQKRRFRDHPESFLRGSASPVSKLTEQDILDIRAAIQCGETLKNIGRKYGVTATTIWSIKHGKYWRHI